MINYYQTFLRRNDVVYYAYEYAKSVPSDDEGIKEGAFEAGLERQVEKEFNRMAARINELENGFKLYRERT